MENGNGRTKDPYNARIQLFITKNMRQQLTRELGFLPSEVDDMLPSVAAILCNKKMVRPSKGMPIEWRRSFHSGRGPLTKAKAMVQELWSVAKHHKATAAAATILATGATVGALYLVKWLLEPTDEIPFRVEEDDEEDDEDEPLPLWARWLKPDPRTMRAREFDSWLHRWNKKKRYYGAKN